MSRGIGGWARKITEDSANVIYEYGSYNDNNPKLKNPNYIYDGKITINKIAFVEEFTVMELIMKKLIEVKNCSNCWETIDNIDIIALHILRKLFSKYQDTGEIPKKDSYNV